MQLYGFDISDAQYPPKDIWPENLTLGLLDSLVDPPPSLVEQFDVIHLRMWASNLHKGDTQPIIQHIKRLLSMSSTWPAPAKSNISFYRTWRLCPMGRCGLGEPGNKRSRGRGSSRKNEGSIQQSGTGLQVRVSVSVNFKVLSNMWNL